MYVAGYHIFRNDALIATVFALNYSDTTVTPDTTYAYSVSAFDTSKNESAQTAPIIVTTPPVHLTFITVTPANTSINVGGTVQFKATGNYNDGSTKDITASVAWSSSNPAVASISNQAGSQGKATGLSSGATTIAATGAGAGGSTTLTGGTRDLYAAQIATSGKVNLYRKNAGAWTLLQSASKTITAGTF